MIGFLIKPQPLLEQTGLRAKTVSIALLATMLAWAPCRAVFGQLPTAENLQSTSEQQAPADPIRTVHDTPIESGQTPPPLFIERNVVYRHIESEQLTADIYRLNDSQIRPAVLLIHGGAWTVGSKTNLQPHARQLAQAGLAAISINYRLAPKHVFPAQLEDCQAALKWLVANGQRWNIGVDQIAVYGYSAGGHLAALLATDPQADAPRLVAAVCGGAPCEFSFVPDDSQAIAHVMGGTPAQIPETYRRAAPLEFASSDDCPMFFFHGTRDFLVPDSSSRALYEKLKSAQVPVEYYSLEGQGHLVTFFHQAPRDAALAFLKKHFKTLVQSSNNADLPVSCSPFEFQKATIQRCCIK